MTDTLFFDLDGTLTDNHAATEGVFAARAMMIGDRAQDMLAARANDVGAIGVLYGYGSAEELTDAGADALCESVDALPAVMMLRAGRNTAASS